MRGDGARCDWLIRTERFCACVVAAPARCLAETEEEERERGRVDDSQTQVFTSHHVEIIMHKVVCHLPKAKKEKTHLLVQLYIQLYS